jgi:hypothetical protein
MTMVRWGTSFSLAREFVGGGESRPEVVPATLAAVEIEMSRDADVWQPILAASGLSAQCRILFPSPGFRNKLVGRTPWSARDALVPPVREESVDCDYREADQGVGRGRGRPPHYLCNCPETGKACGIRLSARPGGLKGRLQARLPATRGSHIDASGPTSFSTTSGFAATPKEGRDESRPRRQECLRHVRGRAQASSQSVTEGRRQSNPKVRQ